MLGSTTVPTAALLRPLLTYVLLHCRTAALLLFGRISVGCLVSALRAVPLAVSIITKKIPRYRLDAVLYFVVFFKLKFGSVVE